jgi:hypothetical protein
MSNFTQGPWVAKGGEVCTEEYEAEGQIMHDHICCCEVINGESPNANLIAAAPELLEALHEMVSSIKITLRVGHERIVELGGYCDSPEVMIKGHSEIARAEAAIAKALGQ